MDKLNSENVKKYLKNRSVHQKWVKNYRCSENEKYFNQVFDYISRFLSAPENSIFLDAGCGSCSHSMRLAKRGFFVQAIDFSEEALKMARKNVAFQRLENKINIQREDICALSFKNNTFNYILCWGVLMHIPDLEKAVAELACVLKPGGILIISENNMHSLESKISRIIAKPSKNEITKNTPAGIEYWWTTPDGAILARQANVQYLIQKFKNRQIIPKKRIAGQFTEAYTKVSAPFLKHLIHAFINFWFKYIKIPYPALGNILIFEKKK